MKYDDASWHSGGEFPANSPEEYGGTHIALFLRWCFSKGWAGELHLDEEPEDTRKVTEGRMAATEYFFKYCDGKFTSEDLNEEGNEFAGEYYGGDGLYLDDYAKHFSGLMYVSPENSHDFSRFSSILDARLQNEILTKTKLKQSMPWWKVW